MTSLQIQESSLLSARGKVVLITGGASGIGKAAAELFHSLGARVVVGDVNEALGNALVDKLKENIIFCFCDVRRWSSLCDFFETAVKTFGKIDIVIANAGVPEVENIFDNTFDSVSGKLQEPTYVVLDINLKGVMATLKLAKYYFETQKSSGSVVITSSTAGVTGEAYLPAYTASKHAVIGLMRSVCAHGGTPFTASNVRVNCVAPFMTETGFMTEDLRRQLKQTGTPINNALAVAKAMAYLALTEDVTGQTIYVADNKFTELEGPLKALRPQWLGKDNSNWLEPEFEMS